MVKNNPTWAHHYIARNVRTLQNSCSAITHLTVIRSAKEATKKIQRENYYAGVTWLFCNLRRSYTTSAKSYAYERDAERMDTHLTWSSCIWRLSSATPSITSEDLYDITSLANLVCTRVYVDGNKQVAVGVQRWMSTQTLSHIKTFLEGESDLQAGKTNYLQTQHIFKDRCILSCILYTLYVCGVQSLGRCAFTREQPPATFPSTRQKLRRL